MTPKSTITGYQKRDSVALATLLAPGVLGTILLVLLPALVALAFAFTSWDGLSKPIWRGFGTFAEVFQNHLFWTAARNSALFVLLAIPLRLLGALGLALLLRQRRRGIGFYRMSVFLPTVVPDVAYALIWLWMFNPLYGPLNITLKALGLAQPAWLADGNMALLAIVLMSVFQIGEGLVVLLTGLQGIPDDYYQSASLDGANRWQKFRYITMPMLAPWLLLLSLRDIILSAQSTFTPAYLMTGGGPYYATLFMPLLMYQEAFEGLRFGHAAAIMLLLLLAVALLIALVAWLARGWGYTEHA